MVRNMEPLIGKRGEHTAALRRRVNSPYQYITRVCFTQYMFFPIGQTCPKRLCDYQGDRPQKNIQQNAGCKDRGGLPPLFRLRYLFEQRLHASAEAEPRDDMVHPAAARTHVHTRIVPTVGMSRKKQQLSPGDLQQNETRAFRYRGSGIYRACLRRSSGRPTAGGRSRQETSFPANPESSENRRSRRPKSRRRQ